MLATLRMITIPFSVSPFLSFVLDLVTPLRSTMFSKHLTVNLIFNCNLPEIILDRILCIAAELESHGSIQKQYHSHLSPSHESEMLNTS